MKGIIHKTLLALAGCCMATAALAQQFTNGTYGITDGSYSIQVEQSGDALTIVEPNKTSTYARQADGTYHFYNENTDATYGLRVVDADTIEAFKPFVEGNMPTQLDLISAATAAAIEADDGDSDGIGSIAEKYEAMALSDSSNAHVWSACAAAAYARSTSNEAEFGEYVGLVVQMLKPIMAEAGGTPCADAIPDNLW
jgi:hypothetical protein